VPRLPTPCASHRSVPARSRANQACTAGRRRVPSAVHCTAPWMPGPCCNGAAKEPQHVRHVRVERFDPITGRCHGRSPGRASWVPKRPQQINTQLTWRPASLFVLGTAASAGAMILASYAIADVTYGSGQQGAIAVLIFGAFLVSLLIILAASAAGILLSVLRQSWGGLVGVGVGLLLLVVIKSPARIPRTSVLGRKRRLLSGRCCDELAEHPRAACCGWGPRAARSWLRSRARGQERVGPLAPRRAGRPPSARQPATGCDPGREA